MATARSSSEPGTRNPEPTIGNRQSAIANRKSQMTSFSSEALRCCSGLGDGLQQFPGNQAELAGRDFACQSACGRFQEAAQAKLARLVNRAGTAPFVQFGEPDYLFEQLPLHGGGDQF